MRVAARLVQIGNSRGIRIPKPLIEEAGLSDEVELEVQSGTIVVRPAVGARSGWAEAAERLAGEQSGLLDEVTATRFDDDEWAW